MRIVEKSKPFDGCVQVVMVRGARLPALLWNDNLKRARQRVDSLMVLHGVGFDNVYTIPPSADYALGGFLINATSYYK